MIKPFWHEVSDGAQVGFFFLGQGHKEGGRRGLFGPGSQPGIQIQGLGFDRGGQFQGFLGRFWIAAELSEEFLGRTPAFQVRGCIGKQRVQRNIFAGELAV